MLQYYMEFYLKVFFQKLIEYHQRKICTYGNDIFPDDIYRNLRKGKLFFVDY